MAYITAKKIKMSQIFKEDRVIPVTLVAVLDVPENMEIAENASVKIVGTTKGRGFQGGVKRWGFHGGPKTHGQKDRLRAPGSIGATAPQRVLKGHKMAGHMGVDRKTVKNVKVIAWNSEAKTMALKGAIPGASGSKIKIYL